MYILCRLSCLLFGSAQDLWRQFLSVASVCTAEHFNACACLIGTWTKRGMLMRVHDASSGVLTAILKDTSLSEAPLDGLPVLFVETHSHSSGIRRRMEGSSILLTNRIQSAFLFESGPMVYPVCLWNCFPSS